MFRPPPSREQWASVRSLVDGFLADRLADPEDAVVDVTVDPELDARWYVRMVGEEREFITVWLTLGQRTLRHETYVLPAPEENAAAINDLVLRQHHQLAGARFSIGPEDALFLVGEVSMHQVDEIELDQVLGRVYETVERLFPRLVRLAFASKFASND